MITLLIVLIIIAGLSLSCMAVCWTSYRLGLEAEKTSRRRLDVEQLRLQIQMLEIEHR